MAASRVLVVGQLARDLVLTVPELPDANSAVEVGRRRELLGGKGANQAVALAQLGVAPTLLAVAGDDEVGDHLLAQARRDNITTSYVVRRPGVATGLIVEVLDAEGRWRYLQHLPEGTLLTEADVAAAGEAFRTTEAVLVQLQQPSGAALAAAARGRAAGRLVVLDGVPADDSHRGPLLAAADVLRADDRETALLTGVHDADPDRVGAAAVTLLDAGPRLLALGLGPAGNLFVWRDDHSVTDQLLVPLTREDVVDTTGAGDALTAALTVALLRGEPPWRAARCAVAAAGTSVGHPGGRPDLSTDALADRLADLDDQLADAPAGRAGG